MQRADGRIADGDATPPPSAYAGYENWKGWTKPFTFTSEEAVYFTGETRGVAVADADVLEIGFGSGSFLAWARTKGARVAGIEIIPALLAAAKEAGVELLAGDFERATGARVPRFDTIIAFDVFEHLAIDEIHAELAGCAGLLRPGGHLVLRFPNAQSPFGLAPQHGDPTHKAYLSRSVFEQLIQGTPWQIARYGPAYRVRGGGLAKGTVRAIRYAVRDLIATALNFVYTQSIPWDPVVVLVMRKDGAAAIGA